MLDNYPPGAANDPDAPWNEKEIPTQRKEVLLQVLISIDVEGEYNEEGQFEMDNQSLYNEIDKYLNGNIDNIINYDIIDIE